MELLKALIVVSEKAANIARACRQHEHLFEMLIQKKSSSQANPRFVEDFKTLADVLIQEMVKHDIKNQFQGLSNNIIGEENNIFENKLGEKICVEIKATEKETSDLLEQVLNGDHIAAALLAFEVHKEIAVDEVNCKIPTEEFQINLEELGVWIDPIDCTAEYINGSKGECVKNIHLNGLKCVTVLIGVFSITTGMPAMGVVNRPFLEGKEWSTRCIWGVSFQHINFSSELNSSNQRGIICISSSERDEIKQKLREKGFYLIEACGAGYKILTVILGLADAYLLTKGTTFKWDTCAPHSILKSLGGNIVDFEAAVRGTEESVTYFLDKNNCNTNGIIAYKHEVILKDIVDTLKN